MVKRKGFPKKKQALHLSEFLGDDAPVTPVAAPNWSAESSTDLSKPAPVVDSTPATFDVSSLPSAPRAQREGSFDPSKVPRSPPFTAFVGNLPFDFNDEDVIDLFANKTVKEVRLLKEKDTGHFKGFGYVEFHTAEGLIEALKSNEKVVRNRSIKVDVATGKDNRDRGDSDNTDKWERGRSNEDGERKPYVDTTSDDWRRDVRPQDDGEPVPYQRAPRRYEDSDKSPRRYGGRGGDDSDTFSRDDFGTKMNEPAKESPRPFRDGHDHRGERSEGGDRTAWRPRDESQTESAWVRHGDPGDDDAPRERPRLNIKPRSGAPVEQQSSQSSSKPSPFGAAKPVDIVERERPDGAGAPQSETPQKPKSNPFGSARPTDTANWRSARAQGTGPIKTPTAQKIDDVSDEIITDSNKFLLLNDEESVD